MSHRRHKAQTQDGQHNLLAGRQCHLCSVRLKFGIRIPKRSRSWLKFARGMPALDDRCRLRISRSPAHSAPRAVRADAWRPSGDRILSRRSLVHSCFLGAMSENRDCRDPLDSSIAIRSARLIPLRAQRCSAISGVVDFFGPPLSANRGRTFPLSSGSCVSLDLTNPVDSTGDENMGLPEISRPDHFGITARIFCR